LTRYSPLNLTIFVGSAQTMMASSYFVTGQKGKTGGGGGDGGVGFTSTVQVIEPDGSVQIRPVNAHGGYLDAHIETYDYDDSLCFMDAVSDLDPKLPSSAPETTNLATEQPLATEEGFAMASWNLEDNSSDGYNSIPSEGSWSWNGSTSGGGFRDGQLHTVYDTRDQQHGGDESSSHGSCAHLAPHTHKTTAGGAWSVGRTKAAVSRATTGHNRAANAAATTVATTGTDVTAGGDETIAVPNTLYDRIKSAFRDNQTEDNQTSHGGSTNSARMATSTNAQGATTALSHSPANAAETHMATTSTGSGGEVVGNESTLHHHHHHTVYHSIQTASNDQTEVNQNGASSAARATPPNAPTTTATTTTLSHGRTNATTTQTQLPSTTSAYVFVRTVNRVSTNSRVVCARACVRWTKFVSLTCCSCPVRYLF
jgi:hypothetical protein